MPPADVPTDRADVLLACRELNVGLPPASKKNDDGTPADVVPLLDAVSIDVFGDEIVAVTAPSGAGKSTLLRALARLHPFVTGTLDLEGTSAETIGAPAYRRRVHYVAQRAAFGTGTVLEEINRPHRFASATGEAPSSSTIEDALDAVGLARTITAKKADVLSEGERQRVSFVRSLLIHPRVLLLDEPTSALDKDSRVQVEAAMRAFLSPTTAVVLVSHDEDQLERLGARPIDLRPFVVTA